MTVNEKFKIYLDTNIIYGYFKARIKEMKFEQEFAEPKVIEFLKKNSDRFDYFVSTLVKAEIFRRLRTELNISREKVVELWSGFISHLKIVELKLENINFQELLNDVLSIVEIIKIKKRVTNLQHIVIAKKLDIWFLTGDNEMLRKCKQVHTKLISYTGLRRLVEKDFIKKKTNDNYEKD